MNGTKPKVEEFSLQQLRELATTMDAWQSPERDPEMRRRLFGMQFAAHFSGLYDWSLSPEAVARIRKSRQERSIEVRVFDDLRLAVFDYGKMGIWLLSALQDLKLHDWRASRRPADVDTFDINKST